MEISDVDTSEEVYKVYTEKTYVNSNKDPFGITLNGKTKTYIKAHEKVQDILSIRGKVITTEAGKIKVLDAPQKQGMVNPIVEVIEKLGKGNVEVKVYNPSLNKKKGATIEIRKRPEYDFSFVEKVKNIITNLLDGYLAEKDPNNKYFTCDICKWETRFAPALKGHMKRMHVQQKQSICSQCEFTTKSIDVLETHMNTKHEMKTRKRQKANYKCDVNKCASTFYYESNLNEHKRAQHLAQTDDLSTFGETQSPTSSPPRKRLEKEINEHDSDMLDLDEMEIIIEKEFSIKILLENRISELENQIELLKTKHEKEKNELMRKFGKKIKIKSNKQLVKVHEEHLNDLKGFKMKVPVRGDGRCLENCTALHAYGNEEQGIDVRIMINEYVAQNFEYWKEKIPLPYSETIYIGGKERKIEKKTEEEMIDFLKNDKDALKVYSTGYGLNAIANLFNVKIHIFTYEGDSGNWNIVCPDPEAGSTTESPVNYEPEMFLYHSRDNHYDLLVSDGNSSVLEEKEESRENPEKDGGITINPKDVPLKSNNDEESLLAEEKMDVTNDQETHKDIEEEITLLGGKNSGHRRVGPQTYAEKVKSKHNEIKCEYCDCTYISQALLDAHMRIHKNKEQIECDQCDLTFSKKDDLEMHMEKEHVKTEIENWNCNDCPFQGNEASELMKHLKLTGHQPSPNIKDKKSIYSDYRKCYTCDFEVDGYVNLMNHRKEVHPSNRKCRNFPDGKCNWGKKCWWVHAEDLMDFEETTVQADLKHKCYNCNQEFETKDSLKKHKKTEHPENVRKCENFSSNKCKRNDTHCWFIHQPEDSNVESSPSPQKNQVFCKDPKDPFPPEQFQRMMQSMEILFKKVIEQHFKKMME